LKYTLITIDVSGFGHRRLLFFVHPLHINSGVLFDPERQWRKASKVILKEPGRELYRVETRFKPGMYP
jgi:hypothetical protein